MFLKNTPYTIKPEIFLWMNDFFFGQMFPGLTIIPGNILANKFRLVISNKLLVCSNFLANEINLNKKEIINKIIIMIISQR